MFKDFCDLCGVEITLESDMLKLEITRRGSNKPACTPVEMCPHCKEVVVAHLGLMRERPQPEYGQLASEVQGCQ